MTGGGQQGDRRGDRKVTGGDSKVTGRGQQDEVCAAWLTTQNLQQTDYEASLPAFHGTGQPTWRGTGSDS